MKLEKGSHIHLMGICGTAMASLAGLLKDRGYRITGSDSNPYPPMSTQLESLGIQIQKGYKAQNLNPKPDFVIVGNVISASNEEAQELLKLKIPYTSLPQAMGEWIIADLESVVIAGTHGKTTTTSLMSWVAEVCGQKPGFLIGGIAKNFSQSFRNPLGRFFVIEGDEYDTAFFDKVPKFIHYKPKHVILTSVEFDHADIYRDLDHVKEAFEKLIRLIPSDGHLIAQGEDKNILSLLERHRPEKLYTYGFKNCDFVSKVISFNENETTFEVHCKNKNLGTFTMGLSGDYNVLNATAVVAQAHCLNFDLLKVAEALKTFTGIKRRQEILGEPKGILIIEDFAHHPTAVKETVTAIQNRYKTRKVYSVFEPRSATSRRKVFQKEYVEAFSVCHEVLLAKAFDQSKIDEENRFSSEELVQDLKNKNVKATVFDSTEAIVDALSKKCKKGDVILIMSNGGFDGIYQKLLVSLS